MTSSSNVRFVSSIIAVRLPVSLTPTASKRAGSTVARLGAHLGDAEALGEALRRVDREAEHALALPRRGDTERRGGRRLADAARAHGDEHALRRDQLGQRLRVGIISQRRVAHAAVARVTRGRRPEDLLPAWRNQLLQCT